jgi:hypothetical protein
MAVKTRAREPWRDEFEDFMAGAARNQAPRAGFYVTEQTGDTAGIRNPPNFKPRKR